MNSVYTNSQFSSTEIDIVQSESKIKEPEFYEPDDRESISALKLSNNPMFIDLNHNTCVI